MRIGVNLAVPMAVLEELLAEVIQLAGASFGSVSLCRTAVLFLLLLSSIVLLTVLAHLLNPITLPSC